jgi:ectoine hydroxylase-related dioxygenase (phytanoyl-CoA dioxygenase family)
MPDINFDYNANDDIDIVRDDYERRGFTVLRSGFNEREVEELFKYALKLEALVTKNEILPFEAVDSDASDYASTPSDFVFRNFGTSIAMMYPSHVITEMKKIALNANLQNLVSAIIRSDTLRYYYDEIYIKRSQSQNATPYHQDLASLPFSGSHIPICWTLLTDPHVDQAPLTMVEGSHQIEAIFYPELLDPAAMSSAYKKLPTVDEFEHAYGCRVVVPDVKKGDTVVFHPKTVHGSLNNNGRGQRVSFVCRWLGDDVRLDLRDNCVGDPRLRGRRLDTVNFEEIYPVTWNAALNGN